MKKGILLLIGMMAVATVNATTVKTSTNNIGVNYRYNDAVTFVERGIQFHVFLNGDFDFDTHCNEPRYVDYYGRRTRINDGVRIERDYRGRVRRVGNTFINYDIQGNVKRIGSVYMRYDCGQLTDVGNLQIRYDRWGYPHFYGNVKYNDYCQDDLFDYSGFSIDINIGGDVCDYDDVYFYRRDFRNNYRQFKEDNDFYYYRATPNANIGKRSKLLRRRKPARNSDRKYRTYSKRQKRDFSSKSENRRESTRTPRTYSKRSFSNGDTSQRAETRNNSRQKRTYKSNNSRDFSLESESKTRANKATRTPIERQPTRTRRR